MFSPDPSHTWPASSSRIASSYPAFADSVLARIEFRYCPDALAWGIRPFGEMRRQDETLARTPLRLPSSPRYAPQGQTATITSTGADLAYKPISPYPRNASGRM